MDRLQPLLVIVGPTASGKTSLSIRLAKELGGEVVSADSMQMYRHMDIGTAKPTLAEREGVPHHLIDVLETDQSFSVADYAAMARPLLLEIGSRGRLPILTGGTGLYISTIVDNIQFSPMPSDPGLREELKALAEREGNGALLTLLRDCDPETAATLHENNQGRVIRALEVYRLTGVPMSEHIRRSRSVPSPYRACTIGLTCRDRQKLYRRIEERVDMMMAAGLAKEAREILSRELSITSAQAIGYKEFREYFEGRATLEDTVELLKQESRNYAKRQLTWFRRDKTIHWLETDTFSTQEELTAAALEIAREQLPGNRAERKGTDL